MEIRFGTYGYLDNNLLKLISVSNGYEFTTSDNYLIKKYNFKERKSPYSNYISYRLKAKENTGYRIYNVRTFCTYKDNTFFVENFFENKFILRPLEEAMKHFKDYPKQGYDPVYEASEDEVTDIWEERKPIEGFKFDVEPMVYLKKNGKWINNIV